MEEEMKFSLDLLESNEQIVKLILDNLKKHLSIVFDKALPKIEKDIKSIVKEALISEPEYASLKAGTLRAEFGIQHIDNVDSVVDALVNTLNIEYNGIKVSKSNLNSKILITMVKKDDISGIIFTDIASVIDDKGYSLPWLRWLLLEGNKVIVQNYSVNYTNSPRSRSGMALMIQSDKNWRVPTNFAGSENNNWVTRAIDRAEPEIIKTIQNTIENYL
jgi:hypothetical protein